MIISTMDKDYEGNPDCEETTETNNDRTSTNEKRWWSLAFAFILLALVTLVGKVYGNYLGLTNMCMLYLLPVIFASASLGVVPSIIVAFLSILSFDIFFVPPVLHLTVNEARYLITFTVFMIVAFTTGNIADRLRYRMKEAIHRETRTRALYDLASSLSAVTDLDLLASKVVSQVSETIDAEVALYFPEKDGQIKVAAASKAFSDLVLVPNDLAAAQWTFNHARCSGIGTETLPGAKGFYLPVKSDERILGVLGVKPIKHLLTSEQFDLLEALAGLAALAIGRLELAAEAQAIKTLEESERLRTALFNSISHDLKTPLASILGAVSSLVDEGYLYNEDQKMTLLTSIKQGALRMNRLIGNLLDMARLESGYMMLHKDWCDIQDIIGVTLRENQEILGEHHVKVEVPETTRLIKADYALIEQVLTNLLHNAVKYSPNQTEVLVRVFEEKQELIISVADQGDGIPVADEERIFDKFYRLQSQRSVSGTGLGLSICRGIIEAHAGRIWAKRRPSGGSILTFTLPIDDEAPRSGGNWQEGGFLLNGS